MQISLKNDIKGGKPKFKALLTNHSKIKGEKVDITPLIENNLRVKCVLYNVLIKKNKHGEIKP